MAVLVEAITVIIRVTAIEEYYPGGLKVFLANPPNSMVCADRNLARVGFMTGVDVEGYIRGMKRRGFTFLDDEDRTVDIAVADQQFGFTMPCDWAEVRKAYLDGNRDQSISICRLMGDEDDTLITPAIWRYQDSLSQTFSFVPLGQEGKSMDYLGHKEGLDVYHNKLTGEKAYIGRVPEE